MSLEPSSTTIVKPDYTALVRFLVEPFLESPDSLKVDCEPYANNSKLWIRLAFSGSDKGRVFGRGGRTIQAIRTVVEAAGRSAGQSVHLEVLGGRSLHQPADAPKKKVLPKRR